MGDATLTAGAVEKMVSGEVNNQTDMTPVLRVTIVKPHCDSDARQWHVLMVHDGSSHVRALFGRHLNGFVEEKLIQVGTVVRLIQFVCNTVRDRKLVYVYQLEVMPRPTELLPTVEGTLTAQQLEAIPNPANWIEDSCDDSMSLSGESFVAATQESDGEDLKANVLKLVASFRETLSDAKRFIHNTKVSKDEIRASIRCFSQLVDNFHGGWDDFRATTKRGLPPLAPEGVRPQADDSEELSSDKLRLIAASLLKYFRKNVFKLFINAFSPYVLISSDDDAKTALMVIKRAVEHDVYLVHRVMNEGFDGIDRDVDEDDDVDIWW